MQISLFHCRHWLDFPLFDCVLVATMASETAKSMNAVLRSIGSRVSFSQNPRCCQVMSVSKEDHRNLHGDDFLSTNLVDFLLHCTFGGVSTKIKYTLSNFKHILCNSLVYQQLKGYIKDEKQGPGLADEDILRTQHVK